MTHLLVIFLRFPLRIIRLKIPFCLQKADTALCTSYFRLLGNMTRDQYYAFQRHQSSPVFLLILEPWKTRVHFKIAQQVIYHSDKD